MPLITFLTDMLTALALGIVGFTVVLIGLQVARTLLKITAAWATADRRNLSTQSLRDTRSFLENSTTLTHTAGNSGAGANDQPAT